MRDAALMPVRMLLARVSRRARAGLLLIVLISAVVRLALLAAAREISQSDLRSALGVSLVVGLALAFQRLVQARVRVEVECDLQRAATTAIVEGDVLETPPDDLHRAVFEGEWRARSLLTATVPQVAADVLVCVVVVPYLASVVPTRMIGVASAALLVVLALVIALRRITRQANDRVLLAAQEVYDQALAGIEGRLELAARGGESELRVRLQESLSRYARVATLAGVRSAMAGRAPLVAGAAVLGVAVLLDQASRQALSSTLLGDALQLAACLPPILGAVVGIQDLFRSGALVAPLVRALETPRRAELGRGGEPVPEGPFEIAIEDVSFRYRSAAADVLRRVSARWRRGAALVIEGPNGAGKSTFLRLLLALRPPDEGALTVGGRGLETFDLLAYRRMASYLPQQPYLGDAHVTVADAMRMGAPAVDDERLRAALRRVEVLDAIERGERRALAVAIGTLSAGQRQRVALARVLVQDTALVLLDEPDAYLDSAGVALVARIIEELIAAGKMVAVAAHSPELAVAGAVRVMLTRDSA